MPRQGSVVNNAGNHKHWAAIVLANTASAHKDYVKLVFERSYDQIRELSGGGAQPNLNVGKVKATPIPLSSLTEQSLIVTRVNELCALCAELRERLTSMQFGAEALY